MTIVLLGDDVVPKTCDSNVELLRPWTNTNVVLLGLNVIAPKSPPYAVRVAVHDVAVLSVHCEVL